MAPARPKPHASGAGGALGVKNVPQDIRSRYPEVDWRKIAGLRDVLAHAYFSLEDETLWDIVPTKVTPLLELVQRILEVEFGDG